MAGKPAGDDIDFPGQDISVFPGLDNFPAEDQLIQGILEIRLFFSGYAKKVRQFLECKGGGSVFPQEADDLLIMFLHSILFVFECENRCIRLNDGFSIGDRAERSALKYYRGV